MQLWDLSTTGEQQKQKELLVNKGLILTFTFHSDWLRARSNAFYIEYFYVSRKKYDAWKVFLLEWCLFERLQVQLLGVVFLGASLSTIALDRGRSMDMHISLNIYICRDWDSFQHIQQLVHCAHFHKDWPQRTQVLIRHWKSIVKGWWWWWCWLISHLNRFHFLGWVNFG